MKYLCSRHQQDMETNEENAIKLWHSAMAHGKLAYEKGNWRLAQSFYGSAFEIATIRLRVEKEGEVAAISFSTEQLTDACRMLVNVLCRVDQFDEAEEALLYVHHFLIEYVGDSRRTYDEKKYVLALIDEFLKRVTSIQRIRGKSAYAESIALVSNKLTAKVRYAGLH